MRKIYDNVLDFFQGLIFNIVLLVVLFHMYIKALISLSLRLCINRTHACTSYSFPYITKLDAGKRCHLRASDQCKYAVSLSHIIESEYSLFTYGSSFGSCGAFM